MLKKLLMMLWLSCAMLNTWGTTPLPRAGMDIDGKAEKIPLKLNGVSRDGRGYNPAWAGDERAFYLHTLSHELGKEDWEDYTVTFTPGKDGTVIISLKGLWHQPKGSTQLEPIWNYYDAVEIEGAEIVNGDFEILDANGLPKGWKMASENLVSTPNNKYVKVWFAAPVSQSIKVTKGRKVVIKAKVKKADEVHAADIFPITFWSFSYLYGSDLYEKAITDEQYQLIKDCHFNLVMGGPLSQAEKFNLKSISCVLRRKEFLGLWWPPYDRALNYKLIRKLTDAVKGVDQKSPALWGYHLADEPDLVHYSRVGWLISIIKSIDPNPEHKVFINCLPGTDPEAYIKATNPDIIGYDKYPIFVNDGRKVTVDDPQGSFDNSSFLVALAQFRKAALKYHKPFIVTILATGHYYAYKVKDKEYRRDYGKITEAKLRWQAYSSLAYNVDGIAWYKYFTSYNQEGCDPSAIGLDMKPTQNYYWLKTLNNEVFHIAKILKQLKSEEVYETKPVYFWKDEQEKEVTLFPADDIIKKVDNALTTVSKFTGKSREVYLIIVNRDIQKRVSAGLDMKWNEIKNIELYDRKSFTWGKTIWQHGDKAGLTLELAPGDGEFLKINLLEKTSTGTNNK